MTHNCEICGEGFEHPRANARWCLEHEEEGRRLANAEACKAYRERKRYGFVLPKVETAEDARLFLLRRVYETCRGDEDCSTCVFCGYCPRESLRMSQCGV